MLKELLSQSLAKAHREAGLYLEEDDHVLYLKRNNHVVSRFNATKVSFDEIYRVADAWLNNICPVCGVSWNAVSEMLQGELGPDNYAEAEYILGNCSECKALRNARLRLITEDTRARIITLAKQSGKVRSFDSNKKADYASPEQLKRIFDIAKQKWNIEDERVKESLKALISGKYNITDSRKLTKQQADDLIRYIESNGANA